MASKQVAGGPTSRRYSEEEKAAAVRMVSTLRAELGMSQGTVKRVADQLGYGAESVRTWFKQADIDDGQVSGASTEESARLKALEQENRELRRANEILKRAASFFGAELDRQHKQQSRSSRRTRTTWWLVAGSGSSPSPAVLQVAPSTYYTARARPLSARARRDAELGPVLRQWWEENCRVYGARKLWKAARRAGYDVGRDQVARLMRAEGIAGVVRTKRVPGPRSAGPWKSVEDVELATLGWVHWHNTERLHGYLGDLPPVEYGQAHYAAQRTNEQLVGIQ